MCWKVDGFGFGSKMHKNSKRYGLWEGGKGSEHYDPGKCPQGEWFHPIPPSLNVDASQMYCPNLWCIRHRLKWRNSNYGNGQRRWTVRPNCGWQLHFDGNGRCPYYVPIIGGEGSILGIMFWIDWLQAIRYIHSQNIIHLDLKPENIMCVSQASNKVKLIDFGLAQWYDGSKDLLFMAGTPEVGFYTGRIPIYLFLTVRRSRSHQIWATFLSNGHVVN